MLRRLALNGARRTRDSGDRALSENDLATAERAFNAAIQKTAKRLGNDPDNDAIGASARIGVGRVQLARGRAQAADRWFSEVQQHWPADWQGFYWSGCAAAHGTSYARAEWFFTAAVDRGAPGGTAHLQRAYVRARLGHDLRAVEDLAEAARHRPLDAPAADLGALLALRRHQAPQAERFAAMSGSPLADAVRAVLAHRRGDAAAALAASGRALAAGLDDPVVLLLHGAAAYRTGAYDESIASWSRLHGRGDLTARARYARALRRRDDRDFTGAIADFTAAAPYGFDAPVRELRLHAAAAAVDAGDLAEARRHLQDAGGPRADVHLGLIAFAQGDTGTAETAWHRAPDEPAARLGRALALLERGERPETELKALCEPDVPPPVRLQAGRALAALRASGGDWAGACAAFEAAGDPPRSDAVYGEALYRSGRAADLLQMPENPWRLPALLQTGADPDGEPGTGRAGREAALSLRAAAYDAAAGGDWERAAERDRRARAVFDTGPALIDAFIASFGGGREAGADLLGDAPAGSDRTRALMLLHGLKGIGPDRPDLAERCIAAWAPILADDDHWERRRQEAERRYAATVPAAAIAEARARLRRLVEETAAAAGAADAAALMHREIGAAEALAGLGGLPGEDGALVCGPLRIAELGLHRSFARFAAALDDPGPARDLEVRFSAAGVAQAAMDRDRPGEALKAALDLRCPDCRRDGPEPDAAADARPLPCGDDCTRFGERNPALADAPEGREALRSLAAAIACDALQRLAAAAVAKRDTGAAEAVDHWRRAVRLAALCGRRGAVESAMVETAIGRGETLFRRGRHTQVVDLLQRVHDLLREGSGAEQGPGDGTGARLDRVATLLSEALTQRGVKAANDGDAERGRADLDRAVGLAPHQIAPRRNLGVVLMNRADQALADRTRTDVSGMIDVAGEAVGHFEAALRERPRDTELTRLRDSATELKALLLNRCGVEAGERGRTDTARKYLLQAIRTDPRLRQTRLNLATMSENAAMKTLDPRHVATVPWARLQEAHDLLGEAVAQYTEILARHGDDPELRSRLKATKSLQAQLRALLKRKVR